MPIKFISEPIAETSLLQNLSNKGFRDSSPSQGGTYVVQPPTDYQELFFSLQKTLDETTHKFGSVRIPHATAISAKVIDLKPGQEWSDAEKVQRVYQKYCLYHVQKMYEERPETDYQILAKEFLQSEQSTLAKIANALNEAEALAVIESPSLRETIKSDDVYKTSEKIQELALQSINKCDFSLSVDSVKLTSNGSVIFQLSSNPQLLDLRIDLILAGQGISKWPNLLVMKNAWSTVGYMIDRDAEIIEKVNHAIENWVIENQGALGKVSVPFNRNSLGALGFRSNDFIDVKRATFPLGESDEKKPLTRNDLRLTPLTGRKGVSPAPCRKTPVVFPKTLFLGRIDQKVESHQPESKSS